MKIVFDTNVILDVLLAREPHLENSKILSKSVEKKIIKGYLCATTITTIDYFLAKSQNRQQARMVINELLELFLIAEVNQIILKNASLSDFADFEDAVLYQSGVYSGVEGVVTRNSKDFKTAVLPIYTPDELLTLII